MVSTLTADVLMLKHEVSMLKVELSTFFAVILARQGIIFH